MIPHIRNNFFLLLLAILFLSGGYAHSQSLKGLWHGYITADGIDKTGFYAINLDDQQGDLLAGKSYLNRPDLMADAHNVLQFIGTLNKNKVKITELKILTENLPIDIVTCIKFGSLEYSRKNNAEYLTGRWNGYAEDGGYCLPGTVFLMKYVPSKDNVMDSIPEFIKADIKKNAGIKPLFLKTELTPPVIIQVNNSVVRFELYDYMKQDNDTVSVYFNRNILLNKIAVTKKVKKFNVRLNKNSDLNEFILHAENLGQIPPNTSTLTVIDGKKRYRISIETTLQKSAVIYLRRSMETPNAE
ncbi:MAG: hypothetical protein ACOH2A_03275 [Sphingobacteriaceae bacterium]